MASEPLFPCIDLEKLRVARATLAGAPMKQVPRSILSHKGLNRHHRTGGDSQVLVSKVAVEEQPKSPRKRTVTLVTGSVLFQPGVETKTIMTSPFGTTAIADGGERMRRGSADRAPRASAERMPRASAERVHRASAERMPRAGREQVAWGIEVPPKSVSDNATPAEPTADLAPTLADELAPTLAAPTLAANSPPTPTADSTPSSAADSPATPAADSLLPPPPGSRISPRVGGAPARATLINKFAQLGCCQQSPLGVEGSPCQTVDSRECSPCEHIIGIEDLPTADRHDAVESYRREIARLRKQLNEQEARHEETQDESFKFEQILRTCVAEQEATIAKLTGEVGALQEEAATLRAELRAFATREKNFQLLAQDAQQLIDANTQVWRLRNSRVIISARPSDGGCGASTTSA